MLLANGSITKLKFEPYKECPCKSGINYKNCCYEKSKSFDTKQLRNINGKRVLAEAQQSFTKADFETCFSFHNDACSQKIIGAHSLQNKVGS